MIVIYKNELYHHGIDGQKWGVRNGPPYPLSRAGKVVKKAGRIVVQKTEKGRNKRKAYRTIKKREADRIAQYNRLTGDESSSDIQGIINRMNLDQRLDKLVSDDLSASSRRIRNSIAAAGAIAGSLASIYALYKALGGTPFDISAGASVLAGAANSFINPVEVVDSLPIPIFS